MTLEATPPAASGKLERFFTNQSRFDFVGRSRLWLFVSIGLVVLAVGSLGVRGLNFGIDFTGGTAFVLDEATLEFTAEDLRAAAGEFGIDDMTAQVVETEGRFGALVSVSAEDDLTPGEQQAIRDRLMEVTGAPAEAVSVTSVGPRWGAQISRQALNALVVFLVLVVLYIALRFEWRMAAAAFVTLVHDVLVTVGIYALVGFNVSPASVIALLTILGYSLYDTVVVFDRVKDETAPLTSTSTQTYGERANEAVNEVLLRSLSTSITSLLPVGSLLLIGANLLGAATLSDLALALFIGMALGTYSSIFVATPALVWLKEREPKYADLRERIEARRGGAAAPASGRAGRKARNRKG